MDSDKNAIYHSMTDDRPMKTTITMDQSGRLVLPKNIRQSLNTPSAARFEVQVLGNRVELTLAEPESARLRRKGKLLVVPKQGVAADAVKALSETRADRL